MDLKFFSRWIWRLRRRVARWLAPPPSLPIAGWDRIGRIDGVGRRSLWMRVERQGGRGVTLLLRSGRHGEREVSIGEKNPCFESLRDVLAAARYAAEREMELSNEVAADMCSEDSRWT